MSDVVTSWPVVSLFDFCNPKQWPTIPQSAFVEDGYPVYGANGKIGFYTDFNHAKPTVLITCRGATCGTINVCEPKSYVTGNAMALDDLDESKCRSEYLVYALRSGSLAQAISGTAQPQITRQSLTAISIPLPPLAEQQRIAEVLDRAEALRAKRRNALAQLDSLTQSLFLEMFGDPATNPMGWPQIDLGEVVKLVGGYAFKSEDFTAEGNAVVRISNLSGDGIDLDGIARIPDEKLGKGVGYKIQPGDILIAMSGATTGKLGVVPLELSEDLYQNQRVGNYRILEETRIQREFLLGFLQSKFYHRFLWQLAAGAAQPNVSGWQLESAIVPLPPIELQREFARRVTAVETMKTAHRASLAELDALFATLQHRAFRGEL